MVASAVIAGAVVVGSVVSSQASSRAAKKQRKAQGQGMDLQQQQYEQTRADQAPWRQAGEQALQQQQAQLGLGSGQAVDVTQTPGYQFRFDQGLKALDKSAAARGQLGGGGYKKALMDYGQGIGGAYFDRYFNQLGVIAGTGQTAVRDLGQYGQQNAAQQAASLNQSAQLGAANSINQANNFSNLINQGAQLYAQSNFNNPNTTNTTTNTGGGGGFNLQGSGAPMMQNLPDYSSYA